MLVVCCRCVGGVLVVCLCWWCVGDSVMVVCCRCVCVGGVLSVCLC